MSIENVFNSHGASTRAIELQELPEYVSDEGYPAAHYGDVHSSLEAYQAYQAYDEGYLAEAPWALEAYLAQDCLMENQ